MTHVLHILTRSDDPLAEKMIEGQRRRSEREVTVVDLTVPEPDYRALVRAVFSIESVHVW
jgi:hypothetical protein